MPIHIIGDKSITLRDERVKDHPDPDIAPMLLELEAHIKTKFNGAQFLLMVQTDKRSHYIASDRNGPLRKDIALKMLDRLRHLFVHGE